HHDARRGAVRQLARIAGRDVTALAHRLESGEALDRRVGPVTLVALERDRLEALRLRFLVDHLADRRQGHDLAGEAAGLLGGRDAALAFERVGVLRLAGDAVA